MKNPNLFRLIGVACIVFLVELLRKEWMITSSLMPFLLEAILRGVAVGAVLYLGFEFWNRNSKKIKGNALNKNKIFSFGEWSWLGALFFIVHAAFIYQLGKQTYFGVTEMGGEAFMLPIMLFDFPAMIVMVMVTLVLLPLIKLLPLSTVINQQMQSFLMVSFFGGIQWYLIGAWFQKLNKKNDQKKGTVYQGDR